MNSKTFTVSQSVTITYDESKFTNRFMEDYRSNFHDFRTILEHLEHITGCYVRGIINSSDCFLEGYGYLRDFGIEFEPNGSTEVEEE